MNVTVDLYEWVYILQVQLILWLHVIFKLCLNI